MLKNSQQTQTDSFISEMTFPLVGNRGNPSPSLSCCLVQHLSSEGFRASRNNNKRTSRGDNKGFLAYAFIGNRDGVTLVEVMVAVLVLLFVMMGLLQAALLSIDHNLRNVLRDEAIRIADQRMNGRLVDSNNNTYDGLRLIPFSGTNSLRSIATGAWTAAALVPRNFRNLTKTYSVCWRITTLDTETIQIEVAVGWNHKNENPVQAPTGTEFVHQITTLRRS